MEYKKEKVLLYSLLKVEPGPDPSVQAVSLLVMWSESRHKPGGRLPLLSARPAVTSISIHQMSPPIQCSRQPIIAYYSFIDLERMKGWVGLLSWPVADSLPTIVVTHQLEVERRTATVCQPETDVLSLSHATNQMECINKIQRSFTHVY